MARAMWGQTLELQIGSRGPRFRSRARSPWASWRWAFPLMVIATLFSVATVLQALPAVLSLASALPSSSPAIPQPIVSPPMPPAPAPPGVPNPAPVAPAPAQVSATTPTTITQLQQDLQARWVENDQETPFRSGPTDQAATFNTLPQWTRLKLVGTQVGWDLVYFAGDGADRQAGQGWVSAAAVGPVDPPLLWLRPPHGTTLWSSAAGTATAVTPLPSADALQVVADGKSIVGSRIHVRFPGDGGLTLPAEGWVEGQDVAATPALPDSQLPGAFPADLTAQVHIKVPYRSQLDGTDYAEANCGPTALSMALGGVGRDISNSVLRSAVLQAQDMDPDNTDEGTYIWALAGVAATNGAHVTGLYDADGSTIHRWSTDELKNQVQQGHPVVVQVLYRALPGRQDSQYYEDHYVVLTGLLGDSFLYDDPIGGAAAREIPGWDRVISASSLSRAMDASDTEFAYSAFALSQS